MTRTMRARIKNGAELATMTSAELQAEMRRLDGLVEARHKSIDEMRRQISRLLGGHSAAKSELSRRAP